MLATAGCDDSTEQQTPSRVTKPPVESTTASPTPSPQSEHPTANPTSDGFPNGSLVQDFPENLIPLMDDTQILVSDVELSDGKVSVSLVTSTGASPKRVLDFYDQALKDHNFDPLESNSVEGAASRTYTRGQGTETVNISVVESGSTSTVTIGAHLAPESVDDA